MLPRSCVVGGTQDVGPQVTGLRMSPRGGEERRRTVYRSEAPALRALCMEKRNRLVPFLRRWIGARRTARRTLPEVPRGKLQVPDVRVMLDWKQTMCSPWFHLRAE
jgi:hypothetical protein